MGLDMYLTKKSYIGAYFEHRNVKGIINLTYGESGTQFPIKQGRIEEISERIGYWRKANAIHKWFVDHVQDGEDDCREYYVSKENLQQLLETCEKVLVNGKINKKAAQNLLPPQTGFFFGSTEIDEGYKQDIENTIKVVKDALAEAEEGEYCYRASW